MAIVSSICLFIVGIVGATLSRVLADDFKEWAPSIVEKLIDVAVSRLPAEQRKRFAEEWRSHVQDVPGQIAKLWLAVGFNIAALEVENSYPKTRVLDPATKTYRHLIAIQHQVTLLETRAGSDPAARLQIKHLKHQINFLLEQISKE